MKEIVLTSKKTGKPYVPHKYQKEVHDSKKRFRVVICGRRWGKTLLALMDLVRFMITNPNSLCFWVVPKYKHLLPVSDAIREWIPHILVKTDYQLQQTYRYIEFHNGSRAWFHSCEDPNSLRGPGLDFVVLEEAAQMKDDVWPAIIRPELIDSDGKALIISTPKGQNWLYQEYLRAKSGKDLDYCCWQRSSADRLTPKQMEEERRRLPEDIFKQEYLAQFISGGGTVFRGVRSIFKGSIDESRFKVLRYSDGLRMVPRKAIDDRSVYIGIDIGRHEAFTVFLALDEEGELVGFERFRKLDFPYQKERLLAFLKYFPRRQIALDARGIGSSFFEDLRMQGVYIEGIKLTNPTKNELVHNCILKLDDELIYGPAIESLIEEMEAYTYSISRSGNPIYSAPENYYDDCVMALVFAASLLKKKATDWISLHGEGYMTKRV